MLFSNQTTRNILFFLLIVSYGHVANSQSGQMSRDSVMLGIHFLHGSPDATPSKEHYENATPSIWDYFRYMPEDVAHMAYADFWHWWYEFERYKGDEKGLAEMDAVIQACLEHGMKVKIDLAWSTWWTMNKDWQNDTNLALGPVDVDDWIHLCDLLGRRYRGRVAMWLLQGEANDLEHYWQGASKEYVAEIYRSGYRAFKQVDPGTMISISGATPSLSRESLNEWVRYNAKSCLGLYDDISMNFFADIKGADPYHGLANYYSFIRKTLDDLGQHHVEIGSGESSFQWAADSYDVKETPPRWIPNYDVEKQPVLSEEGQAWRCNESLGTFFQLGGNKFMFWAAELGPGNGWPWRWGLRKYQDWWGIWPEETKIPGTNIVARYDNPDGRKVNLEPGWTSTVTDPYHPIWHVYKFWAQASPPASEAIRLPITVIEQNPDMRALATYLRTQDRCVVLLQNEKLTAGALQIDLAKTGWPVGTSLAIRANNKSIDYLDGKCNHNWQKNLKGEVTNDGVSLDPGTIAGFTTIFLERDQPSWNAECLSACVIGQPEINKPIPAIVVLKNTGKMLWTAKEITLVGCNEPLAGWSSSLPNDVAPGQRVSVAVTFPPAVEKGYITHILRMRRNNQQSFGPSFSISTTVEDLDSPRKLVAFRELGHIRLKWFGPKRNPDVGAYELYRSEGFQKPFNLLAKVNGTDYIDEPPIKDHAYYYRIVAIDEQGRQSPPSNEDNAKSLSVPRIWDAEIVEHNIPPRMKLSDLQRATVVLRNTGSKAWPLADPKSDIQFAFITTQLWDEQNESHLPKITLPSDMNVEPGQTVTVTIPYAACKTGRFENHWILRIDIKAKGPVYIGTPLLVETRVDKN